MKPELKKQWAEALRSGDYKQGTGVLKQLTGRYCCLGVLCEITNIEFTEDANGELYITHKDIQSYTFPPNSLLEEYDLSGHDANVLAGANDKGDSFETIANFIEEHVR